MRTSKEAAGTRQLSAASPLEARSLAAKPELNAVTVAVKDLLNQFGIAADMLGIIYPNAAKVSLLTVMVSGMSPELKQSLTELAGAKKLSDLAQLERVLGQGRASFNYKIIQEPTEAFLLYLLTAGKAGQPLPACR